MKDEVENRKTEKDPRNCPVAKICGGCKYSAVNYADQLKKKEKKVRDLLTPLCKVRPIVGAQDPLHYRNKVHWAFGHMGTHLIAGRYAEGSHKIIENDHVVIIRNNEKYDVTGKKL